MTVPRSRRALRNSLLGALSVVLLQCGARYWRHDAALPNSPTAAPPASAPATRAGPAGPATPVAVPSASSAPALRGSEASISRSLHVALGTPRDADPSDEYHLDERSFVLSYNPERRVANWVAWQLDATHLGHVGRKDDFRADLALPARFYRVKESDYLHSGYDRGHLCPSADRQRSAEENSRTFLFTNIQPQLHELNAGPWEKLESYARRRAQRGAHLYVVAGGIFGAPFLTIGNGVAVPAANFKIIVELKPGQSVSDVDENTEVLAVSMPNERGVGDRAWTEYLTTVDAIERVSGYDFLNAIPERVQRVIEARTARP
ncbi:MAG TPA: DNA/RNA non-specific endonuclease [Polyangiaceae bacterium]|nr:DNA/RNA non-specific endonuclease [Polyangiaceae bacterium]